MTKVLLNNELNGVEIFFGGKPEQAILKDLKENSFRWNGKKLCWYAKQSEKTIATAQKYTNIHIEEATETKTQKNSKKNEKMSLWDRVQFVEGNTNTSEYDYKYTGSNYTGLSTKDTAKEIRSHLKKQFSEVKFSVTSSYNTLDITIKSSPYNNKKLEYDPELSCSDYREYEKEHNKELLSILEYCNKLANSYNFDDSDTMSDYFHTHFYSHVTIDYDYIQTEQTESIKKDIEDFRSKIVEAEKAEEERKEQEYQEQLKKQKEQQRQYELRIEQEKKKIEIINNSIDIIDLEEERQYFILSSQFARLNKNSTLSRYKEEVAKGEYYLQNCKVSREVHFKSAELLEYFSNLLLNDFDFLQGTGGSHTDDKRVNSMTDYYNMTEEERQMVDWYSNKCVAVYFNNKLQFVIDAQGYSYARYIDLVDNVVIQNYYNSKQYISDEEVEQLQDQAETITDISTNVIENNNLLKTWNNEQWVEYKELIKQELKENNIKFNKTIIQQLPEEMEELKVAMYKLLKEVDGIQEQFKDANIKQGDKITMFYISDWGGIITDRITFDSVEYTEYAQYKDAVKIIYTPQSKRKQYYNYFYSEILVYNGWLDIPDTVLNEITQSNGFICKKSKYGSCDQNQFDEILNHFKEQGIKPIVNTYKPDFD